MDILVWIGGGRWAMFFVLGEGRGDDETGGAEELRGGGEGVER